MQDIQEILEKVSLELDGIESALLIAESASAGQSDHLNPKILSAFLYWFSLNINEIKTDINKAATKCAKHSN